MNRVNSGSILKLLYRKFVRKCIPKYTVGYSREEAYKKIEEGLLSDKPFLCARLGCTELQTIIFARIAQKPLLRTLMKPLWKNVLSSVWNSSGVFDASPSDIYKFADLYESLMPEIDLLGTWHQSERFFDSYLGGKEKISMHHIAPNLLDKSWTACLEGKKILVVSSFSESIEKQYDKREQIFENSSILPKFADLKTIKAIQSIAGNRPSEFSSWFEALQAMRKDMESMDYDIALIACGAYGFPLAAWAKQSGHKAVLMGGVIQLLFGIQGRRFLNFATTDELRIMNRPAWIKPSAKEIPLNYNKVPDMGYW